MTRRMQSKLTFHPGQSYPTYENVWKLPENEDPRSVSTLSAAEAAEAAEAPKKLWWVTAFLSMASAMKPGVRCEDLRRDLGPHLLQGPQQVSMSHFRGGEVLFQGIDGCLSTHSNHLQGIGTKIINLHVIQWMRRAKGHLGSKNAPIHVNQTLTLVCTSEHRSRVDGRLLDNPPSNHSLNRRGSPWVLTRSTPNEGFRDLARQSSRRTDAPFFSCSALHTVPQPQRSLLFVSPTLRD